MNPAGKSGCPEGTPVDETARKSERAQIVKTPLLAFNLLPFYE